MTKKCVSGGRLTVFLVGLLLTAAAETPAPVELAPLAPLTPQTYRADRVIVRLKKRFVSMEENQKTFALEQLAADSGLEIQRVVDFANVETTTATTSGASKLKSESDVTSFAILSVDSTRDSVTAAIQRLEANPSVETAQPDYIYRKSAVPNDPSYGSLWGLKNSAQTLAKGHLSQSLYSTGNPGTSGRDIGAETAWDRITDCSNVVVAVVDTGIKLNHDDLKDNLWSNMAMNHGYDYVNNDTDPTDDEGHGTHVAGTIGARGNNGVGTTGVCWRVQLMGVKVLDADGSGSTSDIISGVNFAVANGAHVINMSLGGGTLDPAFQTAVTSASNAGVLVVVAAGNDGTSNSSVPVYPCNFTAANLICVGAVDQRFTIATFSNYSTTHVDIAAPGTNIVSQGLNEWATSADISLASSDWTSTAGFGFVGGFLQYPAAWDGAAVLYTASANDTTYRTIDMSGTVGGVAYITLRGEAEAGFDYLDVFEKATAGNPVTTGTQIGQINGSTGGALGVAKANLTLCAGSATCSFGFNFTSDSLDQKIGYRIEKLQIDRKIASVVGLEGLNGTSMATPHVAGLAALLKANNPTFTAADLKAAILNTGTKMSPLSSRFVTSAVINAAAAVKFVDAPTAVTAAVVP